MAPHLYIITDRALAAAAAGGSGTAEAAGADLDRALLEQIDAALDAIPPGQAWVQLRAKQLGAGRLLALARALRALTSTRAARLLVNDRVDVALAAGADGVHLPETGLDIATVRQLAGPGFLIGVSTHSAGAAAAAGAAGADVVVLSPIWPTGSKPGQTGLGTAALVEAARGFGAGRGHLFALGGVDSPERARAARAAGAHGIAGIRGFLSPDPAAATAALYRAVCAR